MNAENKRSSCAKKLELKKIEFEKLELMDNENETYSILLLDADGGVATGLRLLRPAARLEF